MDRINELLSAYLLETELFSKQDFTLLTEDAKVSAIKEISEIILKSIEEKLASMDTNSINRSRGDIRQLKEIESLVRSITNLEEVIERSRTAVTPELSNYIEEIRQAIFNLRDHSIDFKEAYRDRKVLLMLKYQSIIMSIFSSVSYLMSVMIDFSSDDVELVTNPTYEEIAPLKAIIDFNRSIELGEYGKTVKSVMEMQKIFKETNKDVLVETSDIINTVLTGIKSFYTGLDNNMQLTDFLYKAAGIVTLIMSLREVFYSIYRARTKFSEILNSVEAFAGIGNGGQGLLSKLNTFANKFKVDAEESSKIAQREIESEDKNIGVYVKSTVGAATKKEPTVASVSKDFSDFNF